MRCSRRYIPLFKYIYAAAIPQRCLTMSTWGEPKELRIPVPYGHIAAKAWGNKSNPPVLALHGWQDNAGTFDRLIPLLTPNVYIVAIDAPGHGFSSHKPVGAVYNFMEMVLDIKRIVDHFKWNKFSIMGHSIGGACGLMFASIYPEAVSNLVALDVAKPNSREVTELPDISRKGVASVLELEKKFGKPVPVYSLDEARDRLVAGLYNQVKRDGADILLKRGCKPSDCGRGVVFSRDIRVKLLEDIMKLSHDDVRGYMQSVTCNLLIIRANDSFIFNPPELLDSFLNLYKKNCKSFQLVQIDGNHFVHLNNPERVAPHVDNFLSKHCKPASKI